MTIEIRELVIRAVVVEKSEDAAPERSPTEPAVEVHAIVEECVRQVLKILKRNGER